MQVSVTQGARLQSCHDFERRVGFFAETDFSLAGFFFAAGAFFAAGFFFAAGAFFADADLLPGAAFFFEAFGGAGLGDPEWPTYR